MALKDNIMQEMKDIKRTPLPRRTKQEIETLVETLFHQMTTKEKVGQLYLSAFSNEYAYGPSFQQNNSIKLIKEGMAGNFVGTYDNDIMYSLQKVAVEESRLKIPLMFMNDIIHGCRTSFPINIGLSATFNPTLIEEAYQKIAFETSHSGSNVTFSPMLDIVQDPRWGRVMESPGEDPYLASEMAKAYVKGFQQDDLLSYNSVASCLKHYVGYGKAEAGRDYNTVDMSERILRQVYLKPFKAGIDAGASMIMSAFNVYDGVPISANKFLLRDVLRDEMKFDGVTISDYASTKEIIMHKIARNEKEAAEICIQAGLDVEIISTSYIDNLVESAEENKGVMDAVNEACKRVLTLKYKLGLFDNPYKNIYGNFEEYYLLEDTLQKARETAEESIVLLENDGVLPLKKNTKVALVGPFGAALDVIGGWGGKSRNSDAITLLQSLQAHHIDVIFAQGANYRDTTDTLIEEACEAARNADVIILTFGEHQYDTGEASSKTNLNVHPAQRQLAEELRKLNKPIIGLLYSGRPLFIEWYKNNMNALLNTWFLGTTSGDAITNVLFGDANPSGKLPVSYPLNMGQIPLYYNHLQTGRPAFDKDNFFTSKYLDAPNEPLYSFGYGLSYSKFIYRNMTLDKDELREGETLHIEVTIHNDSQYKGKEIVQLYIEAESFSVSRPVNELKGFVKVELYPEETKTVVLELPYQELSYINAEKKDIVENRNYRIKVGTASNNIYFTKVISTK